MKVTKRKDGRWHKKITLPNGKVKYFYSSELSENKADKDITKQIINYTEKVEKGELFKFVADLWDSEYREKIGEINYNKSVRSSYNRIFDYFGGDYIRSISSQDINTYIMMLVQKCYSKKVVSTEKSILNMIFRYAIVNGYATENPTINIRLPQNLPKKQRKLPATQELKIVSSHTDGFDLLPFFILYTGCRKSEALAIRDTDIDFINNVIKIRNHVIHDQNKPVFEPVLKTESAEREIILLDRLKAVLPKFKGFLFSMNNDGISPLTKKAFDKRWENYKKKYGINLTAHQLRHGYATMLHEAGVSEKDAQELMGHSDINLTRQIYTHIRKERKEQTANILNNFNF